MLKTLSAAIAAVAASAVVISLGTLPVSADELPELTEIAVEQVEESAEQEAPAAPAPEPAPEPAPAPAPVADTPVVEEQPEPDVASDPAAEPEPQVNEPGDNSTSDAGAEFVGPIAPLSEPSLGGESEEELPDTLPPPPADTQAGAGAAGASDFPGSTELEELPDGAELSDKVGICHSPSAVTNPWVSIEPSVQALFAPNGHLDPSDSDTHLEDIIPPFYFDAAPPGEPYYYFPGKNMDTVFGEVTGAQILANDCEVPEVVVPVATVTDETCSIPDEGDPSLVAGYITVDLTVPVEYTITDSADNEIAFDPVTGETGPLANGDYTVSAVSTDPAYVLAESPWVDVVTVLAYEGECAGEADEIVTPVATPTHEWCRTPDEGPSTLVPGYITVDVTVPVTYSITDSGDNTVAFDGTTGQTGPLANGQYSVSAVDADPNDGYGLASSPWTDSVTVLAYEGPCGVLGLEAVTPVFEFSPMTCDEDGSITLSFVGAEADEDPLTWTIDSVVSSEGTHTVAEEGVVHVVATPNQGWVLAGNDGIFEANFEEPTDCLIADELAQTGTDPRAALALFGAMFLVGLLLLAARRRHSMS